MIGMSFASFLSLLILGVIAAIVMHFVVRYKMLSGFDGFMNKWIAGWIGAWLGSPVLGHWGPSVAQVYIIPALLGAFSGAFLVTSMPKTASKANLTTLQQNPVTPIDLKKAS
jgi:uncharacterized membrane protein YeaQ/YmgE (transglycosylase-associated protein family)